MKKALLLLAILLFALVAQAKEYTVNDSLQWKYWNDVHERFSDEDAYLKYDPEGDTWNLYFYGISTYAFSFKDPVQLKTIIAKYREWNVKASNNNIELNKEIAEYNDRLIWFKVFDEWYSSYDKITAKFASWTTKEHALVFSGKVQARYDQYKDDKVLIVLDWYQAVAIQKAITPEALAKYKDQVLKTIQTESLFN